MARPSSERELRLWLAGKLRRPSLPEWLWSELCDYSYVRQALEGGAAEDLQALLDEARRLLRIVRCAGGSKSIPGRRKHPHPERLVSKGEGRRAEALSGYLATLGASEVTVRRFREEMLGGATLSREQVNSLLRSPAPYLLSRAEFGPDSVAVIRHHATAIRKRKELRGGAWLERISLKLRLQKGCRRYSFTVRRTGFDRMWLDLPPIAWGFEQFPVLQGSVFGELRLVGDYLSHAYPWQTWDSIWFVLTGVAPLLPPVDFGFQDRQMANYARTVVTFAVEPWVSAKTLYRMYRHVQRALLRRDNRPIAIKNLLLFRFVSSHLEPGRKQPTWARLLEKWNRAHPEWKYDDYRHLRRDYRRVAQALVFPKYTQLPPQATEEAGVQA